MIEKSQLHSASYNSSITTEYMNSQEGYHMRDEAVKSDPNFS